MAVVNATQTRRLERSRDDRILAGVCRGIAEHFGIDVTLVRVITVVLAVFGGAGVLLYLVGWAMIPEEGHRTSMVDRALRRGSWQPIAGFVLIAIAVSTIGGRFWGTGDIGFPLFLIGLGAFLLFFRPPSPAPEDLEVLSPTPEAAPATMTTEPGWSRPRRGPRRRIRGMTAPVLGVLAVGAGITGLVLANGGSVDAMRVLAGGLVIVGAAQIVATRFGRAGGLIPVGLVLLVALSFTSALKIPFSGGVGQRTYNPATLSEVDDEYHLAIGELRLDLGRIHLPSGSVQHITATVGIGHLLLEVPRDVTVVVNGHAELGSFAIGGHDDGGWKVDKREVLHQGNESGGRIEIDATVGVGQVEVQDA